MNTDSKNKPKGLTPTLKSHITGVFLKEKDGRFTAFFSEIPEATAQGDTVEEAEQNLFEILPEVLELKNEIANEEKVISGLSQDSIIRKSYNFELSNHAVR